MIGEAFGNYRVTAEIGSGTMGVVLRGEHVRIVRTAAIKVLVPELAQNASAVQRFFTEARATSLIRHPGIVDVFDCDVDETGRAYIVMEHLVGETLADRLRRTETVPWEIACGIARQVAEAIAAAHANGIVHRDLKPDNVFLVGGVGDPERAVVKVLDFGIAKLLTADAARLTMRGMVLGTPEYMAPEQCEGSDDIDERADIYALGCILFEMLSGNPPFLADAIQELMIAHMFRPVPSISEQVPELPTWVAELVSGMLAKRRDERPTSMNAVARALRDGTKEMPMAMRSAASQRSARATAIVVAAAGLSALCAAAWIGSSSIRRLSHPRAPAVAPPVSPAIAREREAAPPVALPPAAPAPASVVDVAPAVLPARRRAHAPERLPRSAAPRASTSKHVVDTDGIVDL
jgi:serine/threonine-protein kinase